MSNPSLRALLGLGSFYLAYPPWALLACGYCGGSAAVTATATGGLWSAPATWVGAAVPSANQPVVIPEGSVVILDAGSAALQSLKVGGTLRVAPERDAALTTGWLMVEGAGARFEVGTPADPYTHRFTLTLTGTNPAINVTGVAPLDTGTKFLMAMNGGVLALHGASREKRSFTVLEGSVGSGATSATLAHTPTGWAVGDQVVIAPSGFNVFESEVVTLTAVNDRTVTFTPALVFPHYGLVQMIEGTRVDQRAEVGQLTRNIIIRGADDATTTSFTDSQGFGGHVMIMPGGFARIEGVRFERMGQRGLRGRYALHWHFVDRLGYARPGVSGVGQWVKNCSFQGGFQRAVNIHGTRGVLIEGNVAHDTQNHAFVLSEDGDETDVVALGNFVSLVRTPLGGKFAFVHNNSSFQNEDDSSAFWLVNPNQTIVGNHVAGVEDGNGIMFDALDDNLPAGPRDVARASLGKRVIVAHNVLHTIAGREGFKSHMYHNFVGFGILATERYNFNRGYIDISHNTIYKAMAGGAWLDGEERMHRNVIADSTSATHSIHSQFTNNTVIGYTANTRGWNNRRDGNRYVADGPALRQASGYDMSFVRNHWIPQTIADNRFIGLNRPGLRIVDGTTWSDGAQAYGNTFLNHSGPRYNRDVINLNRGHGGLLDRDGHLDGDPLTTAPVWLTMQAINAGSLNRTADMDTYLTLATTTPSPFYFRAWFTAARDGDVVAPGATLGITFVNLPTQDAQRRLTVGLDGTTHTINLAAGATSASFTIPAGTVPGLKKIYLSNTSRPTQRLFLRVGDAETPKLYVDWVGESGLAELPPIERFHANDPDHDGRTNFEEFTQGTNPVLADTADRESVALAAVGDGRLEFAYRRSRRTSAVAFRVESSPDLVTWKTETGSGSPIVTEISRTPHGDGTETVKVLTNDPVPAGGSRFFRLTTSGPGY